VRSHGLILHGLAVDREAVRAAGLVHSRVALADRAAHVVLEEAEAAKTAAPARREAAR
jgi:hypothetical protein